MTLNESENFFKKEIVYIWQVAIALIAMKILFYFFFKNRKDCVDSRNSFK
jgi:hypothetical protein